MRRLIAALAIMFIPIAATSQDYERGLEAYDAGEYEVAAQELRPLAEQGDAVAQYHLGMMYADGRGVVQAFAEAARWNSKAAEQGHAGAQSYLGYMYRVGLGVDRDYTAAVRWWTMAAEQGDAGCVSKVVEILRRRPPNGVIWA